MDWSLHKCIDIGGYVDILCSDVHCFFDIESTFREISIAVIVKRGLSRVMIEYMLMFHVTLHKI